MGWVEPVEKLPSYVIFKEGNTIHAKAGFTGGYNYKGKNAQTIIQLAIDQLTNGGTVFVKNGDYSSSSITLGNDVRLVLDVGVTGIDVSVDETTDAVLEEINENKITVYKSDRVGIASQIDYERPADFKLRGGDMKRRGIFWHAYSEPLTVSSIDTYLQSVFDWIIISTGSYDRPQSEWEGWVEATKDTGRIAWGDLLWHANQSGRLVEAQKLALAGCEGILADEWFSAHAIGGADWNAIRVAIKAINSGIDFGINESLPFQLSNFLGQAPAPVVDFCMLNCMENVVTPEPWGEKQYKCDELKRLARLEHVPCYMNNIFADSNWDTGVNIEHWRRTTRLMRAYSEGVVTWGIGWSNWDDGRLSGVRMYMDELLATPTVDEWIVYENETSVASGATAGAWVDISGMSHFICYPRNTTVEITFTGEIHTNNAGSAISLRANVGGTAKKSFDYMLDSHGGYYLQTYHYSEKFTSAACPTVKMQFWGAGGNNFWMRNRHMTIKAFPEV